MIAPPIVLSFPCLEMQNADLDFIRPWIAQALPSSDKVAALWRWKPSSTSLTAPAATGVYALRDGVVTKLHLEDLSPPAFYEKIAPALHAISNNRFSFTLSHENGLPSVPDHVFFLRSGVLAMPRLSLAPIPYRNNDPALATYADGRYGAASPYPWARSNHSRRSLEGDVSRLICALYAQTIDEGIPAYTQDCYPRLAGVRLQRRGAD